MKFAKYNLSILYSILLITIIIITLEIIVSKIPNVYKHKATEIKNDSNKYKTLILGSSHTYFGVNPEIFSKSTFNAANVSQDLVYDELILRQSVKTLSNLQTIIIPISVFSLHSNLENGQEAWRKHNYAHWFEANTKENYNMFEIKNHSIFLAHPQKRKLLVNTVNHFIFNNNDFIDWSHLGWGTAYKDSGSNSDLISTGKPAAMRHQPTKMINQQSLDSLNNIIKICNTEKLKLLLITPPSYISYRTNIDSFIIEDIQSKINSLSKNLENIKYINYMSDDRFISTDFHDADHLSEKGAIKFSKILNQKVNDWK